MTGQEAWPHWRFHLIVTGKSERMGVRELFRSLEGTVNCSFNVGKRIGQLSPRKEHAASRSSNKPAIVGTRDKPAKQGKLPTRDEEIAFYVRKIIRGDEKTFVILLDDLERKRKGNAEGVFHRYRSAVDRFLNERERHRVSVHFFVMMLEAYFFADPEATNRILGTFIPPCTTDPEEISNPKRKLKDLTSGAYSETEHAIEILKAINLETVFSREGFCGHLRVLFDWCLRKLQAYPDAAHIRWPPYAQLLAPPQHLATSGQA